MSSGHVRVYQNTGGTWTQIGADIDGEAAGDHIGSQSVSISADGSIVAIGAFYIRLEMGLTLVTYGSYQNTWGSWTQIGADIDGEAANDRSGTLP